ncbi:MAG: OmpA family protein [Panacagrimonas sp.]
MKKRVAMASGLLAMSAVFPAVADSDDLSQVNQAIAGRFYISPMGSHTWEDKNRDIDDGYGGVLAVGKQISPFFSVELSGLYSKFSGGRDGSLELLGYGLTGLFFPFAGGGAQNLQNFYGLVGAHYGQGESHPTTEQPVLGVAQHGEQDYDTVLGDAGLGFLFGPIGFLNQGALRLEARYRMDFHDEPELGVGGEDGFGDAVLNLGLLIPIGSQPQPPPPPAPPVEVVPVEPPADSDGDGVTDNLDQCPGTPAGTPVNEVGCPLPPPCKTPEPGQPVTLEGCAAGDTIVLRGVNFEFDKARLTTNARSILDTVNDALNKAPSVKVEIGGHTDAKGSDEYNQKLSERRAKSVVEYLGTKGIAADRMTSVGYGEAMPVADNETDEGRELNRRVELKVTEGSTIIAPAGAPPADDQPGDVIPPEAPAAPAAEVPAADAPTTEAPPAEAAPVEAAPAEAAP